jgi:cobalt-zinc-cadmium efflux system protein
MLAEAVGAWFTNSLALLADAGHMLSDAAALTLTLFAVWAARQPARAGSTFGYHRAEILAALLNGTALLAIALFVFLEALQRIRQPPEVEGLLTLLVAGGGLAMNLIGLRLLDEGRHQSLNMRGAWLHVLSDALGSIGAMTSAALVTFFGWLWADPLASMIIAVFIVYSAWALLRETVAVLMESAPGHIDVDQVRDSLSRMGGVAEVHDLHVWTITSGMESLSAHLVPRPGADPDELLGDVRAMLSERFGIGHVTIQIESATGEECGTCT